jgi:hypothetical protein
VSRRLTAAAISDVQILASAGITEDPAKLQLGALPDFVKVLIATGRLQGMKPILMYWPNGVQAHTMIPLGDSLPPPERVISAYRQASMQRETFPNGVLS